VACGCRGLRRSSLRRAAFGTAAFGVPAPQQRLETTDTTHTTHARIGGRGIELLLVEIQIDRQLVVFVGLHRCGILSEQRRPSTWRPPARRRDSQTHTQSLVRARFGFGFGQDIFPTGRFLQAHTARVVTPQRLVERARSRDDPGRTFLNDDRVLTFLVISCLTTHF